MIVKTWIVYSSNPDKAAPLAAEVAVNLEACEELGQGDVVADTAPAGQLPLLCDGHDLQQVLDILTDAGGKYQMRGPGMTTVGADGNSKTLYMANIPSLEAATKPNLKKTLEELGVKAGAELVVADATSPNAVVFKVVIPDQ